jgi:hypothetical protein
MQSWLIGIGNTCPTAGAWMSDGTGDCYLNSTAVNVPAISSSQLAQLQMSGTAVSGGNDTLVFTSGTEAYSTTEPDSLTDLASAWASSEFNIIGDGNSSEAVFGSGASITVNIAVTSGTPPTCESGAGTTGETNNLTLGSRTASGSSIQFTESSSGSADGGSGEAGSSGEGGASDAGGAGDGGGGDSGSGDAGSSDDGGSVDGGWDDGGSGDGGSGDGGWDDGGSDDGGSDDGGWEDGGF